jgi:CRP-like cAMP-binding protein
MLFTYEEMVYAIGIFGAGVYLGSYALLQLGILKGDSYTYSTLNILAPSCVMVSLLTAFNMSSAIIQTSWIIISIVGISRNVLMTHFQRFTPDEELFLYFYMPLLPRRLARTFLNTAETRTLQPGEHLTHQGEVAGHVAYIIKGRVEIGVDGHKVGESRAGSYIGELTFLDARPATATTQVLEPTTCLIFSASRLHDLLRRKPEIQTAVVTSFSNDTREKLLKRDQANINLMAHRPLHQPIEIAS